MQSTLRRAFISLVSCLSLRPNRLAPWLRLMALPGLNRGREGERSPREAEEWDAPASMLQAMVDHVAEAVAMFDANQRLVAWNRQLPAILDVPASLLTKQTTFEQ